MDYNVLVPSYYDEFACLGGACRYTCCQEWPIHVRKNDYKELMKARVSPEMKAKLRGFVSKMDNNDPLFDENQRYGRLRMAEDAKCPLLTEEGFCGLQIECGAERLPYICKIFPRIVNLVADAREQHMRLACEATVRTLTQMTEPIQFRIEQNRPHGRQASYAFEQDMSGENPLILHYWNIKALGVGILQNRFYTLPQRILYLGFVLERLLKYETQGRLAEVETLLQGLMEQEDSEALRASLERLPTDAMASTALQLEISNVSGIRGYNEMFVRVLNAIGCYNEQEDTATIQIDKYRKQRDQYDAFCAQHPHVMENIAVALFHELSMPFGGIHYGNFAPQRLDIWRNYLLYCREIIQIQFVLGALVTPETPLDDVALMVSIIMRQTPTNFTGADICVRKMEEMGITSIERLSILLKG